MRDDAGERDARAFPLSHAQKGLWFAQQLDPTVPILVAQYVELRGHVDVGALKWASEQGSFDIESPGIRLVEYAGEPFQLADETIEDELGYVDLRLHQDPVAEAHRRMDERRRRPLDVYRDRLISAELLHVGHDHYFLTTFAHHLILDGYGAMVLMNRVAELYTHAVQHTEAPPSKALHLRQLYEAEDEYPATHRFQLDREYWAERTAGLPEPARLTDRKAYPAAVSLLESGVMKTELADSIGALARRWHSSEVPVVVAAFAAYLARMTGSADIVLSLPVSARTTASARRSGGSVANVVPLRIRIDPHSSIEDVVRRVQLELTGALRHQRYRYEDILHDMRVNSDGRSSFGPMVNIMMFHQETWWGDVLGEFTVLTAGPVDDLTLAIYPAVTGHSIRVDFEANPALYEQADLARHHARFMSFLTEFVGAAPAGEVGDAAVLTSGEHDSLVPASGPAPAAAVTLPELLDVTGDSSGVAVRAAGVDTSYPELHDRSNRLARRLIERGIGPEDAVAVIVPASLEQVVAVWAVARCGAAAVPLDPHVDGERIEDLLTDSGAVAVLAVDESVVPAGIDWIDVADLPGDSTPITESDLVRPLSLDHTACVVHGSADRARGVTISHRALAARAAALVRVYRADDNSRILMAGHRSCGQSLHALVAAVCGGTLVIAPCELRGGEELSRFLRRERVTHWASGPAAPAATNPTGLERLQVLALTGRGYPAELVSRWGSGRTVLNLYGPGDSGVWAAATDERTPASPETLGRPIAGVSAVVLDRALKPVPVGVVGDLYLSGAGLGRGYASRPADTAARFVANPFDPECACMYRTGDLARWTDDHLLEYVEPAEDSALHDGIAWWAEALRGVGSAAPLQTDLAGRDNGNSTVHEFSVPAETWNGCVELARHRGTSLFEVLHGALAVLLGSFGGHSDIVVGGRVNQVGYGHVLPLRTTVDRDLSFATLLEQVHEFDSAAFEYADVPFDPDDELFGGRRPQVILSLRCGDDTVDRAIPSDLEFAFVAAGGRGAPATLGATVTYSQSLFDAGTVRSLAEAFVPLLVAVVSDPDAVIGEIPLPAAAAIEGERAAKAGTLAGILTATADAHPDAPALTDGVVTLSYRELAQRSDALAHELAVRGARPGTVVALALPRSVDFVIALWAVAKTGAAFLPVDPTHPAERLSTVLGEAAVQVGIGRDTVESESVAPAISWLTVADAVLSSPRQVAVPVRPDDLAYVIYTSGSTGAPKGVMVTHRGLSSLVDEAVRRYDVSADSRVLQGYNPTFDAAMLEILLAFGSGACLVVAPADVYAGPDLQHVLTDLRVTHYLSTPAVLGSLESSKLDALRVVAVGGEALTAELAAEWSRGRRMLNAYGPTESTVVATLAEVDEQVTIGAPVPGTIAVVLDARLRPVPVGGVGELYLRGAGLARGYVGASQRTASRFVASGNGSRMYRTGDLVHRRADGRLSFVARVDRQVKIRGVRIEPSEIDVAIARVADVESAVTVSRPNAIGVDALVSYVVPRGSLDVEEVRESLAQVLPSYLVPTTIVVLDAFPLTASGKTDLDALPVPVLESHEFRAPNSVVEQVVAGVFAEVLGLESVGLGDDFFALGGNSLIAAQVAARLGAAVDAHIPVRMLFESPRVEALATRVEAEAGTGHRVPLVARDRPDRIPLSPAQQRLWFLNRVDPESPVYNLPLAVRLTGGLDVDALRHAARDLLGRHESLRTVFPAIDGVPAQVVLPVDEVHLDLTPVEVSQRSVDGEVLSFLSAGFDVTVDAPVRGRLLKVGEHEHVLVMAVHHISADGFSLAPLARDVATAYDARARGAAPTWTALPVQYADFALWQRETLGSGDDPHSRAAWQLDYWTRTLAGVPDVIDLPTDRPRPPVASFRGATVRLNVSARTHRRLTLVAQQHNATLFMVVHSALAVLLARLTGSSDVALGTAVAGRGERELDELVGMFVNTLVLRTGIDLDETLSDVLERVRETDLAALAHSEVPFEQLVERMNPPRSQSFSPLFQVMLAFQNQVEATWQLPGLTLSPMDFDAAVTKFDLDFSLSDRYDGEGRGAGLSGRLTYATDLFDATTAERVARLFEHFLDVFAADPTSSVGDIRLLTETETSDILVKPNCTAVEIRPETVVDLFDVQVRRAPDAIAVVFEGQVMTYAELDERANRFARLLIGHGIQPDTLAALAVERSLELVVATLAILKAGAGFVPVDPEHPAERIAAVIEASAPMLMVTTSTVGLPSMPGVPHVEIDTAYLSGYSPNRISDADRLAPLHPDNVAYTMFTSGSTGTPKGVTVSHRAIVNQLHWLRNEYHVTADDRGILRAPSTFDVSVWECLLPLCVGAQLVVTRPGGHRDVDYLASVIRNRRITMVHFVPSVLAAFLADGHGDCLTSVRHVFAGGEELSPALAANVLAFAPGAFHNTYGPTEAAVTTTACEIVGRPEAQVPIGGPVWNTQVFVLDTRLRPVPAGVAGELFLAGAQLARGYVGRSDLTAGRFVANPFGPDGSRMYRTGDLVKWDGSGRLVHVGRTDFQVKLRGLRIELGEIETVLERGEGVSRAAVALVDDARAGEYLVGYVRADGERVLDPELIKATARRTLPSYMVPTRIVVLEEFPLGPNGKLDRRALPSPQFEARKYRAPETASEVAVATAFGDALGIDRVGADDNFFELGGNSLLAVRVLNRLGSETGVEVPLRTLMSDPTPHSIAQRMDSGEPDVDEALGVILPIRTVGTRPPLFCVHPIMGLSWCYSGLASHLHPEHPIYGIQSPAVTASGPPPSSLDELAAGYVEEIRRIQAEGPYHLLGWSLGGVLAHAMAVQLQSVGEEVATLVMLDSRTEHPASEALPVGAEDLLAGLGFEDSLPFPVADLTTEAAVNLLGRLGGPLSAITPAHLHRMIGGAGRHHELTRSHVPRVFHGDVLFFAAGQEVSGPTRAVTGWEPYVVGSISEHVVDSGHWHMTSQAALKVVGAVLREREVKRKERV
ncbi:amino acid adenylation domain-containing protein [Rhodococcus sp. WB9]|uniref:non-ribosomal peptide synthetase n=1 Tax=Rhodococcus sp. WB9 TaxID=2594007 RepID=UPI0011851CB8|nr:non-ribosomal peptide synthetase [Rhodococcus sp. WB9]QDQ90991.1 amino acid adenylation domain-containing protein [Rhodococcus sp. WB9]